MRSFRIGYFDLYRWVLTIFFFSSLSLSMPLSAQQLTPQQWEAIQSSDKYLIGMGMGNSVDEARQAALSDLSGKISVKVSSQFDYHTMNETNNKNVNTEEKMKMIIKSYSSVTLNNVAEYMVKNKSTFVVYRYMKVSDMRAMFKRRVSMAKKWAMEAVEREKENKVGDALQDFYWSLALLRSCPDADLETIAQDSGNPNMIQDVFRRVKDILTDVRVKAVSVEKEGAFQRVVLDIRYKNQPVVNFNYRYVDGKHQTEIFTAKDGIGELLLPRNASLSKLRIYAEYECRDEANIHPDLKNVMESTDPVPFASAEFKVDTKNCPQVKRDDYVMQVATSSVRRSDDYSTAAMAVSSPVQDIKDVTPYLSTMQEIEKGIAQQSYASLGKFFTKEGWEMFDKLIHFGNAKLLGPPQVTFSRSSDGTVVCRSFPMSFTFKGNRRTFTEDVVFYLDEHAKVCEVAFGLEQAAVNDVMQRGQWSEAARNTMVHFLETYKTAYALKRLDYISSIFSNEALIVTGQIVKGTGHTEMSPAKPTHIKYVRQSKEQYINNLKRCFKSNEYVNIHFAENTIRRSNSNPNIYGIQIKQDYFSSSYGDTGYLFLLIDFTKTDEPLIHVRTWQPDLDPNVKDGRIGIADFLI